VSFLGDLINPYSVLSIIGMCKNAGKTTVLNHIIHKTAGKKITLAFTSVGRDGEAIDIVTNTAKPGIYVYAGSLIATAEGLLDACDITKEILLTTGISTPLGEIVVIRALSGGYVQLAGPSTTSQLERLAQAFSRFGADKIIIDGAVSRKTFSALQHGGTQAVILCTGASYNASMETVVKETLFVSKLFSLPPQDAPHGVPPSDAGGAKFVLCGKECIRLPNNMGIEEGLRKHAQNDTTQVYVAGALSDAILEPLFRAGVNLAGLQFVVYDAGKILISAAAYEKLLLRNCGIQVLRGIKLLAIAINPVSAYGYSFDKELFRESLTRQTDIPVINVQERPAAQGDTND